MKWIISFLSSYLVKFLTYFIKKFGYASVLITIQRTFQVLIFAVFSAFVVFTLNYILQIWNVFLQLIQHINSFGVGVSGQTYGGIDLATIVQASKSFFVASGLSDAFVVNGNLLISFVSVVFIKKLWSLYLNIAYKMYEVLNSGLNLLSNTIAL